MPDPTSTYDPQHRGPRHAEPVSHRTWKSRGVIALTVVSALVGVLILGGGLVYQNFFDSIDRVKLGDLGDRPAGGGGGDAINILLIGSDTREGGNSEYGGQVEGARGDVTLLLHISGDRQRASAVSIPRDSMVNLPSCTRPDGSTAEPGLEMFNAAYAIGGPTCTMRAVEQLTGIFVHHFVVIDFEGFKSMVDALGTVQICVPRAVEDPQAELSVGAGRHDVAGETALAYVRSRHIDGTGDLGRVKRQQAFLSAMIQKATSAGILANPTKLVPFLNAVADSLTTDEDFSAGKMTSIARSVRSIGLDRIEFLTVPNEPWPQDTNRLQWTSDADALWASLRDDSPLPGTESPTPAPSSASGPPVVRTAPSDIRVRVLNGTATPGLAARAADDLRARGFSVDEVGNAPDLVADPAAPPAYPSSVVRHDPGYDESGRTLGASVTGSRIESRPDLGSVLELVVGADYAGVQPVEVAPEPATPEVKLDVRKADQDVCS